MQRETHHVQCKLARIEVKDIDFFSLINCLFVFLVFQHDQ